MQEPGVVFLDHTADVGIGVAAPTLDALFHRAALGMLALLRGEDDEQDDGDRPDDPEGANAATPEATAANAEAHDSEAHDSEAPDSEAPDARADRIALTAGTLPSLLADWLREILFLHEIDGRDYVAADFDTLGSSTLRARVRTVPSVGAVREIKGVTYHELRVERNADGWEAQVIFDV